MTKQEFKDKFISNLRFYLPDKYKLAKIMMRLAKKNEKGLYQDTEIKSIRPLVWKGQKYRIELRREIIGIDEMITNALYRTLDVSWDYPRKGEK